MPSPVGGGAFAGSTMSALSVMVGPGFLPGVAGMGSFGFAVGSLAGGSAAKAGSASAVVNARVRRVEVRDMEMDKLK